MQIRVIPNTKLYSMIKVRSQPEILRVMSPYKDAKIDFLAVGFWVSSILAAILTVPSIGIFVYFFTMLDSIVAGALLAFGIHFALLSVSDRIAKFLIKIIDDKKKKTDIIYIIGFWVLSMFAIEIFCDKNIDKPSKTGRKATWFP